MYRVILLIVLGLAILELALNYLPWQEPLFRRIDTTKNKHKDSPCSFINSKSFLKGFFQDSSRNMVLEANITMMSGFPCRTWQSLEFHRLKESRRDKPDRNIRRKHIKDIIGLKKSITDTNNRYIISNDAMDTHRVADAFDKKIYLSSLKKAKKLNKLHSTFDALQSNNPMPTPAAFQINKDKSIDSVLTKGKTVRPIPTLASIESLRINEKYRAEKSQDFAEKITFNPKKSPGEWELRRSYEQSTREEETPMLEKGNDVEDPSQPALPTPSFINKDKKPHILFAVGILSKLSAIDRRNGVRDTWLKECLERPTKVICRFFTDEIRSDTVNRELYIHEQKNHQDLEYMPYKGGYNFALRLLWMFRWYTQNYEFDYFLRVDDDYFICMDRLLKELPHRPTPIYWGWIHCEPGIVRVDEGFMILSRDLIDEFLLRLNSTLLCSAFGDQAVANWIQESTKGEEIIYFLDNSRIIHQEVTSYMGNKYLIPNICNTYLGLHGTYPDYMRKYWKLYTDEKYTYGRAYTIPEIKPFEYICEHSKDFNFEVFEPPYYSERKLCKYNPTFKGSDEQYLGREGQRFINAYPDVHDDDDVNPYVVSVDGGS